MADAEFQIDQVLKLRQEGGSAATELKKTVDQVKALNCQSPIANRQS